MKKNFLRALLTLSSILFSVNGFASSPLQEEQLKINMLVQEMRKLDAKFVRNGSEYSPERAYDHIQYKRKRAGDRIKTARQFIEYLASRSSFSGRSYHIEFSNGTRITSRSWFLRKLYNLESRAAFHTFSQGPFEHRS